MVFVWRDFFFFVLDVFDMVDVLVEGSEGLDEEIGFLLNEDMILFIFSFSVVVFVVLEVRNKLFFGIESEVGICVLLVCFGCVRSVGLYGVGGGFLGVLEIIVKNLK